MQPLRRITFTRAIERSRWAPPELGHLLAGVPYLMADWSVDYYEQAQHRIGVRFIDGVDVADDLPLWNGEPLDGKRVAYHHYGALGDECVHSAFYRTIAYRWPTSEIHLFIDKTHPRTLVARYNRDIGHWPRRFNFVIEEAAAHQFDHWFLPWRVGYETRGTTDENIYDIIAVDVGLAPHRPLPYLYPADMERPSVVARIQQMLAQRMDAPREHLAQMTRQFLDRPVVVQISASEEARSIPTPVIARLVQRVQNVMPGVGFAICGDTEHIRAFDRATGGQFPGLFFVSDPAHGAHLTAQGLLYLIRDARLVIAPDSYFMHASAAFDAPCLALWQDDPEIITEARIPSPSSRMATYPRVRVARFGDHADDLFEQARAMLGVS